MRHQISKKKSVLAIIPAKSISKSLKNKNLRLINNKHLIYFSIAIAKKSKLIDRVICSTDSEKIKKIAEKYGAEVPFIRPKKYCGDKITDFDVFKHTLGWLKKNENYQPDLIVHLRPTSPLRYLEDINKIIKLLNKHPKADSARSISISNRTPYKMWKINNKGYLSSIISDFNKKDFYNLPRQVLPKTYDHNANIDVIKTKTILEKKSVSGDFILPFIQKKPIIDIDNYEDLIYARKVMKKFKV